MGPADHRLGPTLQTDEVEHRCGVEKTSTGQRPDRWSGLQRRRDQVGVGEHTPFGNPVVPPV